LDLILKKHHHNILKIMLNYSNILAILLRNSCLSGLKLICMKTLSISIIIVRTVIYMPILGISLIVGSVWAFVRPLKTNATKKWKFWKTNNLWRKLKLYFLLATEFSRFEFSWYANDWRISVSTSSISFKFPCFENIKIIKL